MAWTKAKTAIVTTAAIILTAGVGTIAVRTIHAHRAQPDIQGAWEGTVNEPAGIKLRVVLHIAGRNGDYKVSADCIEQRAQGLSIQKFTLDYPAVAFECQQAHGTFKGTVDAATGEMSGTWSRMGTDSKLVLQRTNAPYVIPEKLAEDDYTPRPGSDIQGLWNGTLKIGNLPLRIAFRISDPAGGTPVAEMDSPDQGASELVVSKIAYDKPTLRLDVFLAGGVYEGQVDGEKVIGNWTQAGRKLALTLERTSPKAEVTQNSGKDFSHNGPNDLPGHWLGVLDVQGIKLHLALHVARSPEGQYSSTLDSIDQEATGIPATSVRFTAPDARLEWQTIGGSFNGKVKNGKLSGTWRQGNKSIPLVFARAAESEPAKK